MGRSEPQQSRKFCEAGVGAVVRIRIVEEVALLLAV